MTIGYSIYTNQTKKWETCCYFSHSSVPLSLPQYQQHQSTKRLPVFGQFGHNYECLSGTQSSLQDDATTLWTNPANFAFAPAITKGLAITQRDGNTGFAFAKQVGVLGYGVHYTKNELLGAWWSASSALALRLDEHLSLSTTSTWHSIEVEDDSFVEWDSGWVAPCSGSAWQVPSTTWESPNSNYT